MSPTRRDLLGVAAATTFGLAGCTDLLDQSPDETPDETTAPPQTTVTPPATVRVRSHDELGDVLVGPNGMTLYMFDRDENGASSSTCSGGCADNWPPLTVTEAPRAGDDVAAELSTFEREDGSTQVAAAGWPLYYYVGDEYVGDAVGQGVGGVWWALRPDGTPVRTATGTPAGDQSAVETLVDVPGEPVPENLAIDDDGALYFGIAHDPGEVWTVSPAQTLETGLTLDDVERVAQLPAGTRVIGVEVVPDGALYAAVAAEEDGGVWRVPRDGSSPAPFAGIGGFANDVLHDAGNDRLLVSESIGGAVYEVPLDADDPATAASTWVEDDLLDTASFGANGLTVGADGALYVAVTRVHETAGDPESDPVRGRIVRVPVQADGGSAGSPENYVEGEGLLGADGITFRDPDLYVAANARNEVIRVTPSMETEAVATGDDGLVFPSDVAFGTTDAQRDVLFICNFANRSPEDGAILRTRVE